MRRSLGSRKNDGLDLLLDTICNAFGSIIFIALLIVIISSERSDESKDTAKKTLDRDEVQRRIRTAEGDIERLKSAIPSSSTDEVLTQAVATLESQIAAAKDTLKTAKETSKDIMAQTTWDYSAAAADSAKEGRQLNAEIGRLQNEIKTSDARITELQKYLTSLQASIEKVIETRTEQLRLPREKTTTKSPVNLIFIYDEIFPFQLFQNGQWRDNDAIAVEKIDSDSIRLDPIRGSGLKLPKDEAAVVSQIGQVQDSQYFTCYVFPDSIDAFREFRKHVQNAGKELGWRPKLDPKELLFSTEGSSPNPQ